MTLARLGRGQKQNRGRCLRDLSERDRLALCRARWQSRDTTPPTWTFPVASFCVARIIFRFLIRTSLCHVRFDFVLRRLEPAHRVLDVSLQSPTIRNALKSLLMRFLDQFSPPSLADSLSSSSDQYRSCFWVHRYRIA